MAITKAIRKENSGQKDQLSEIKEPRTKNNELEPLAINRLLQIPSQQLGHLFTGKFLVIGRHGKAGIVF